MGDEKICHVSLPEGIQKLNLLGYAGDFASFSLEISFWIRQLYTLSPCLSFRGGSHGFLKLFFFRKLCRSGKILFQANT